ncbi:MAG: hypothetical protein MJ154_00595 [Candidatus Saccharibacteria bacterium]|nr:hypothetical protein [Candidatus Saccharibacteria bacterium]
MVKQKQKSDLNVVAIILAIVALLAIVGVICLAWFLAIANEKIEHLEKQNEELSAECDSEAPGRIDDWGDFVVKKPLIYLYPTEETEVSVKLGNADKLTSSYPKYDKGWNVVAQKDGSLVDKNTGRSLYGLYWEGANYPAKQNEEGFVVAGKDAASFLEEKLAQLGLTEREANEMIIYWLPQLEKNAYNYIRFDLNEVMDGYMPLNIAPKPDTVIRVSMVFKGLDAPMSVREQKLPKKERKGFTVVEWGGSEIK